ncbi:MAG: hypothetical protein HY711_10775 [Candidatus Melainabacteria bacterium]|nr:hypothetical protein [Candidatus Melainabacteria bacterium]
MTVLKLSISQRLLLAFALTLSQSVILVPPAVLASDGAVRVAGQVVMVNRASSSGMSTEARTEAIQRNLDNAIVATKDRSPSQVNIVYVKGLPVVTLGGYQVVTVDAANAKAANTTPALLAQRWANALRDSLRDRASIDSYVAQLSGDYAMSAPPASNQYSAAPQQYSSAAPSYNQAPSGNYGGGVSQPMGSYNSQPYPTQRGRVVYAPAGMVIPVSLATAISTQVAKSGDMIQATLNQPVLLGDSQIPAGSVVIGTITESKSGGYMGRAGTLGIKFNRLRTPDGLETPITAHIVGGISKYSDIAGDTSDVVKGETWKTKVGQAAIRGAVGAGTGAALGTAVGAIAGRSGKAAGRGAWSGTAIGGTVGVAESLLLRKGKDVTIASGTQMQLQLDAPLSISGAGVPPYTGAF